jgi:hypothetical protein
MNLDFIVCYHILKRLVQVRPHKNNGKHQNTYKQLNRKSLKHKKNKRGQVDNHQRKLRGPVLAVASKKVEKTILKELI